MERKQGIGLGMRLKKCGAEDASCAAEYAKRRREHTGNAVHALSRGVTNIYRRESNCGVIESPMA